MSKHPPWEPPPLMGYVRNVACSARGGRPHVAGLVLECRFCGVRVQIMSKRGHRSQPFTQRRFIIREEP